MAIDRSTLIKPILRKQTVDVPELGGEVIVRGMMASERFAISDVSRKVGESEDLPVERFEVIASLLARVVIDPDGKPLMSRDEWEAFGGSHIDATMRIFNIAQSLSGGDAEAARGN